jgi:hypothetical protein
MRRYQIETQTRQLLAEDCTVPAFVRSPQNPEWLSSDHAEGLFGVAMDANMAPGLQRDALQGVLEGIPGTAPLLEQAANDRANDVPPAHAGVRPAARLARRLPARRAAPTCRGSFVFLSVIQP